MMSNCEIELLKRHGKMRFSFIIEASRFFITLINILVELTEHNGIIRYTENIEDYYNIKAIYKVLGDLGIAGIIGS